MKNIVSVFNAPVSNTKNYKNISWKNLCDICTDDPIKLKDNSSDEKALHGKYVVKGIINGAGIRNDENLENDCFVAALDVDKEPLHDVSFIKEKLDKTGLAYIVHNTASIGRSRIYVLCKKYDKGYTHNITRALVDYLDSVGLKITWVSENKKLSQPWFLPQTSPGCSHKSFCVVKGKKFNWKKEFAKAGIDADAEIAAEKETDSYNNVDDTGKHNPLDDFTTGLASGTIHQIAGSYIGWLKHTTDWSSGQIKDHVSLLVNEFCTNPGKVDRWNKAAGEADKWSEWFEEATESGFVKASDLQGQKIPRFVYTEEPIDIDEIFPEKWADGINEIARFAQVAPEFPAMQALTAVSMGLAPRCEIIEKPGHSFKCSIACVPVAGPGERKTGCSVFITEAIKRAEKRLLDAYNDRMIILTVEYERAIKRKKALLGVCRTFPVAL